MNTSKYHYKPSLSIITTSLEKLSLKLCRADHQIGYQQLRVHLKLVVVQDPIRVEQQSSPRLAVGTVHAGSADPIPPSLSTHLCTLHASSVLSNPTFF